ncbi:hypothetical protein SH668x_002634 [Planctomicrobium sp. SH668]|uniref:hypothetical protein n=1 Tax=Planctomicrobium sp. SH668 TaxID=3448126 RepID=UPI003F5BCCD3
MEQSAPAAPSQLREPSSLPAQQPVVREPAPTPPSEEQIDELMEELDAPDQAVTLQKVYRPSDSRPIRDDVRAEEFGIRKYASKRLVLYTDIDPQEAATLPAIIDQVYERWVEYFGELPPDREGTEFQITGFLIDDPSRFVAAGMLPEGPPMFRFGRHIGQEFWMNKMNSDYYRRHLMIHEATHCFMTINLQTYPSRWYLEGMAEFFGTHHLQPDGGVHFGVMPDGPEPFSGLGRIELIQREIVQQRPISLSKLWDFELSEWNGPNAVPYAYSWALCKFLEDHPRYQKRFQGLGQHLEGRALAEYFNAQFQADAPLLAAEWSEYIKRLCYGMDGVANAFETSAEPLKTLSTPEQLEVPARSSWRSSGLRVTAGETVRFTATGQVVLDETTRAWESGPDGISIEFACGSPIGLLMGGLLPDHDATADAFHTNSSFSTFKIGQELTWIAPTSGELWIRVNDHGNGITNNSGSYQVEIAPVKAGDSL